MGSIETYRDYLTEIGPLTIACAHGNVVRIDFGRVEHDARCEATPLSNAAANQIVEYLAGRRTVFDVPFQLAGSPFSVDVWQCMLAIPYGQTRSYGAVAASAGHPGAARAIGMAANRNPLPLLVPCHRVVGANGSLTGYAGGLSVKEFLLNLEKSHAGGPESATLG